ncbi:MAG: LLM class F420-dependent oxidoreductase [Chloroflexi bacterium]|nr:LLM class F420-dependent oxidoreductase [Chloroflexota bacterium]
MELGVVFPTNEMGTDPIAIRDFAQTAEDLGYTRLVAYDHVLGAHPDRPEGGAWLGPYGRHVTPPYTHLHAFHEPFVLFGFLAGLTSSLEFMTGVLVLPQRQTALVAKQCAQIDILAGGGRLILGVGVGWNSVEFEALGESYRTRGRRMEEQIGLLRQLWTEPVITFEGDFDRVTRAGLNPLPERPIPIWIGAMADVAVDRAGRLADGWHVPRAYRGDPDRIASEAQKFFAAARSAGRDPSTLGLSSNLHVVGLDPDEQLELAEGAEAAGVTHLHISTMEQGYTPEQHISAIRDFAEQYGVGA